MDVYNSTHASGSGWMPPAVNGDLVATLKKQKQRGNVPATVPYEIDQVHFKYLRRVTLKEETGFQKALHLNTY